MSLVKLNPPESTLKPAPSLIEPGPPPPEFHVETEAERGPPDTEMGTEIEPQKIDTRPSERRRLPPVWHQDYHMNWTLNIEPLIRFTELWTIKPLNICFFGFNQEQYFF